MSTKDKIVTLTVATFISGVCVAFAIGMAWTLYIILGK